MDLDRTTEELNYHRMDVWMQMQKACACIHVSSFNCPKQCQNCA